MQALSLIFAVAMAFAGHGKAMAQDEPVRLPEVVVDGRASEERAREFIDQVAAPPRGATVARWHEEICVGVVNLRPETARFLIDRVSSVAMDVGLTPEEPGCTPDVVIVATTDGGTIARGLIERRDRMLAPGNSRQSRSRRDLQAFAEVDRPVRWWHVSTAVNPVTGRSVVRNLREDNFNSNLDAIIANLGRPVQPSFIHSTVRQDLRRAVIIIDFDQIGDDVDFDQLADYVAFVALAQADPAADTAGFDTVLNLFDKPASTQGLSAWDRAYLHGLYKSDYRAIGNSGREAALRREMLRVREAAGAPEPE